MKIIKSMLLLCCLLAFIGCAHAPDTAVPASSDALSGLAEHASELLAAEYPPGHTMLSLTSRPSGDFTQALETSLRGRGFSLAAEDTPGGLAVNVVMEPVAEGELWYLHLKSGDGFSVGQVYTLTLEGFVPVGAMTRTERFFTMEENGVSLPEAPRTPAPSEAPSSHLEDWRIEPGPLQSQLTKWCSRENYQLVWKAENDYVMESSAIFRDDFVGAAQRLFARMHQAGHGLRVRIYPENRVLEVMED